MARLFDGTNDSLQSASAINLSSFNKISIAFWLWWDSFANNDDLAGELSANYNDTQGGILIDPNSATGSFQVGVNVVQASGDYTVGTFSRPSGGAWHQYVLILDISTNPNTIVVYMDAVSQTFTYSDQSTTTTSVFANAAWNVMSRNNASLFGAGRMAELAIYGGLALSQTDATDLQTKCPDQVQAGSRSFYWPLDGNASPEPASVGGVDLTVNGATQTAHPITCGGAASVVTPRLLALLGVGA